MTQAPRLINSVAHLSNVTAFVGLVERVRNRAYGLPGLGVFYGFSGFGKSTAATYSANHFRAYNVAVKSTWTAKKLCLAILTDLGIHPAKTVADMVDQVAEHLARNDRPLIIDEADHLVARRLIEVVRDIYESSGAAIILVGEERLPQNLQQWERVHGRVLDWVAAQPASAADVAKLVELHSPDVPFDADFQAAILTACNGSTRRVCINLETMRMVALENGWDRLTVARWGKRAFFNGAAPAPRRMVNP